MSPDAQAPEARIHDRGYRPFDGPLASVRTRFWVIAANELRQAYKSKWFRKLLWVSFFPLGVFAVLAVVRSRIEGFVGPTHLWPHFVDTQQFFAMLAVFFVGRRAVGEDLRSGALTIYFSRPVDLRQYLLGKWLAVALAGGGVILAPGLVLVLFQLAADPATGPLQAVGWAAALAGLAALFGLAGGWTMLAISALVGRGRAAGIVWVLVFFLSSAAGVALAEATAVAGLAAVGIGASVTHLARVLFGQASAGAADLWWLVGLLGWAAAGAALVLVRLRRWRAA